MKLKKIASLALAGALAVSMLAGCGTKTNNNGEPEQPSASATSIVDAVNDGQSALNKAKITFTADANLDNTLSRIAGKLGVSTAVSNMNTNLQNLYGLKYVQPGNEWWTNAGLGLTIDTGALVSGMSTADHAEFGRVLTGNVQYDNHFSQTGSNAKKAGSEDGREYTVYAVMKYDGASYPTEEAVANTVAKQVDAFAAKLAATSNLGTDGKLNVTAPNKYYAYTYTGNASMVAVPQTDGTTDYIVVIVVNQSIAAKAV